MSLHNSLYVLKVIKYTFSCVQIAITRGLQVLFIVQKVITLNSIIRFLFVLNNLQKVAVGQHNKQLLIVNVCFIFIFQGYGWLRHYVGNWRPKGHCLRVRHPHVPYLRPLPKALESALVIQES